MSTEVHTLPKLVCYHCGEDCETPEIIVKDKHFCCHGCKTVYQVLDQNDLCEYYDIEKNPGIVQKVTVRAGKFGFLDDDTVKEKLIHFSEAGQAHVRFYLPQMHCSSCIWLLEQLSKLDKGIIRSTVNFLKKEVTLVYNIDKTGLRKIAELLTSVGYEPHISLNAISEKKIRKYDQAAIYKIGVAGFCFGNIMMLSFPEYFSMGEVEEKGLKELFSYLNLFLALPVFFYSASGFFVSSWKSLRQKFLNIDAPIALAILITFGRSVYEILSGTGAGYLDSMAGIVFFMLVGRFFQDKTYQTLSFERDYTSYFPLGVTRINEDKTESQVPVSRLKAGHRIKIHNQEIMPADSILFLGKAHIDYSFVTGESVPVEKSIGEIIYAGGKQTAGALELEVIKDVSQSYLTQLWNNETFKESRQEEKRSFIHALSRYFTIVLFSIALLTAAWWQVNDPSRTWAAVTAILIVACPCALLLSATFTNGNMLRRLQRYGFYAKNAQVLERISEADTLVFDKTGTLTRQDDSGIVFCGNEMSDDEKAWVRALTSQSGHPLSRAIKAFLPVTASLHVRNFCEIKGKGMEGQVEGHWLKMGSAGFLELARPPVNASQVFVSIDNERKGYFTIRNTYRKDFEEVLKQLGAHYKLHLLSGDNENEKQRLREFFPGESQLLFDRSPQDKLNYIKGLQEKGKKVIMIGDGLNDAGALRQSDVGIVISDDTNNFSPACDAILEGRNFGKLRPLLDYCSREKAIIMGSFIISILYNIVGLYYAVQGTLEPVIAAILMPASSASIMLFTTGMSSALTRKLRN